MFGKKEFIHSLDGVKLIIGNGFDLHCGLKTKYSDYFEYNSNKYQAIERWVDSYKEIIGFQYKLAIDSMDDQLDYNENWNVWDVFFTIISKVAPAKVKTDYNWCDIEKEMADSLTVIPSTNKTQFSKQFICWEDPFFIINKKEEKLYHDTYYVRALADFILKKHKNRRFRNKTTYYNFLLDELKLFESDFGRYLSTQFDGENYYDRVNKTTYNIMANATIKQLCQKANVVSIDSFNYGTLNDSVLEPRLKNINGTLDHPIFGIDTTTFKHDDPRFIFTKTNRRMELDMFNSQIFIGSEFNNAIIYGHSLNKADYSYFFPLLDKLEMTDFVSNTKIVFAFSIYDTKKEYVIKADYRKAIAGLFDAYAAYKSVSNEPSRLLDSLTTQGRILIYEIPDTFAVRDLALARVQK